MSVQTEITRIESAKTAIATAIEGKGVTVPEGTKLDGMAALVESIEAGGVGVQPDWNQNDSTQPDYVKNRPFYTGDPVETVLVEESTVTFADTGVGYYMAAIPSTFAATVGETYKVYWDGTAYECVCVDFHSYPAIGNLSIMGAGSDTGDPFLIIVDNGHRIEIDTADTSASHTFSISRFAPEVVKIDAKYLPISTDDSYGVVKKADIVSVYNFPVLAPHDQMVEAIAASKPGNASIVWGGYKVIEASYNSSNDTISVVFAKEPLEVNTYLTNSNGFYDRRLGSSTYGELRGNNVRIVNDEGAYAVLSTKGTQSDTTLSVGANRISFYSNYGLSEYELILKSSTENSNKSFKITVDDSGEPTITDESDSTNTWKPTNLPTVTSSDSGKFLRVSDTGEWVAEMQDGSATDTVVTASASAWSNNTITLSVTGVMADSKLEIGLSNTATDEQYAAATAAQIRATGSGDGTVTLKAVVAPSVDLPILIRRLS